MDQIDHEMAKSTSSTQVRHVQGFICSPALDPMQTTRSLSWTCKYLLSYRLHLQLRYLGSGFMLIVWRADDSKLCIPGRDHFQGLAGNSEASTLLRSGNEDSYRQGAACLRFGPSAAPVTTLCARLAAER